MRLNKSWVNALLMVLAVFCMSGVVFAQPETPVPTLPVNWYASVTGVVALTMMFSSVIKRLIGNVPALNAIPMWVYIVGISEALTALCVMVLKTLPGPLTQQLYQAFLMAAAASGFYEWLINGNLAKPMAVTAQNAGVRIDPANMPSNATPNPKP